MPNPISLEPATTSFLRRAKEKVSALRSSSFLRNVGVISSGSAVGHIFTLAAGPILTRVYGPTEFGALGLFTSLLSIMGVAVTLQYEISIPVGRDESEAAYLTIGSLLLAIPLSGIGGLLLWLLIARSWLGFGGLPWFTPLLLTLSLIFVGLFTTLRYWSLRDQQFRNIAQGVVVQSGARAILQAAIGAVGLHASGLLIGETLGRCMGMTNMLRNSWPVLRRYARPLHWKPLFEALWRHRKFPLYSFPSSFLDALCLGLPLPLLIRMYGVSIGGYYSLVWKAITVPSVLVTVAVADTFHSKLAQFARDEPEQVMSLFRATSLGLLMTGLVPAAVVLIWGPRLFAWVFGARWALSGSMAAILVPWYLAQFVVSPLSRVVVVLSGQEMKLGWDVLCLGSLAAVFYAAHTYNLPALTTVKLLSAVYALLFVTYYAVLLNIIARFNRDRNQAS